jgi:ABC-2 type transport system ATP-binding protein
MQIQVENVIKDYVINSKERGLKGSVKGLFAKEKKIVRAVDNVSFSIKEGECVGFIGGNGAGKTTTIKMLSGLIYPSQGSIDVYNYKPTDRKKEFKKQISLVMGNKSQLWWDLSAFESFDLQRVLYDIPKVDFKKRLDRLTETLNVTALIEKPVRSLSLGERMKMELIVSLLYNPRVLFLDEPTIGLDLNSQKNIRKFLHEFNKENNTTVIMTSHYLEDIESVCDRLLFIQKGKLIHDGTKDEIIERFNQDTRIYVSYKNNINITDLPKGITSIKPKDEGFELYVNREEYNSLIQRLLNLGDINKLDIGGMPLEHVVEKIYGGE